MTPALLSIISRASALISSDKNPSLPTDLSLDPRLGLPIFLLTMTPSEIEDLSRSPLSDRVKNSYPSGPDVKTVGDLLGRPYFHYSPLIRGLRDPATEGLIEAGILSGLFLTPVRRRQIAAVEPRFLTEAVAALVNTDGPPTRQEWADAAKPPYLFRTSYEATTLLVIAAVASLFALFGALVTLGDLAALDSWTGLGVSAGVVVIPLSFIALSRYGLAREGGVPHLAFFWLGPLVFLTFLVLNAQVMIRRFREPNGKVATESAWDYEYRLDFRYAASLLWSPLVILFAVLLLIELIPWYLVIGVVMGLVVLVGSLFGISTVRENSSTNRLRGFPQAAAGTSESVLF